MYDNIVILAAELGIEGVFDYCVLPDIMEHGACDFVINSVLFDLGYHFNAKNIEYIKSQLPDGKYVVSWDEESLSVYGNREECPLEIWFIDDDQITEISREDLEYALEFYGHTMEEAIKVLERKGIEVVE